MDQNQPIVDEKPDTIPAPRLFTLIYMSAESMRVHTFASDVDFTCHLTSDNMKDALGPALSEGLNKIIQHMEVPVDMGAPGARLVVTGMKFEDIPHFIFTPVSEAQKQAEANGETLEPQKIEDPDE